MTNSRIVLELLAKGVHSAEKITQMCDLTLDEVREALRTLRKSGRVESVSMVTHYRATPTGLKTLDRPPTPQKYLDQSKRRRRAAVERAAPEESIVGSAMRKQIDIERVWR